jgi:energy-coupling factor transporter ATP-binding protein EcfA2
MIFQNFLLHLETQGQKQFNPKFRIIPDDHEILYQLMVWFVCDKEAAHHCGLSLRKGILLSGPVGCGKTTLMQLIRQMHEPKDQFIVKPCRDVSYEFNQDGFAVINRYGRSSFDRYGKPKTYCFDDLGSENAIKFYGNECNVMAEILMSRYDMFVNRRMITHMTTNLSSSEIEDYYGLRVRSRLREMFNLIAFPSSTKDKRT